MAKLIIVVACVGLLQIASALKCYNCANEKCEKKDMWDTTECSKSADPNLSPACLKNVYEDKTTNKETVARKCVYVPKNGQYKCNNDGKQIFCETCTEDLCNSASNLSLSFFTVTGIFLAFFVPKILA